MERLLSLEELSEALGITKATIYSWTSRNKIPHIKLSKRLLKFRESEILEWIHKKSVLPDSCSAVPSIPSVESKKSAVKTASKDSSIERMIKRAKEDVLGIS